jgi:glutaredoxin-related protein
MKGTPETPQCGFSRASIQILGLQGVDPKKFTAFNVLEDEALRQGTFGRFLLCFSGVGEEMGVEVLGGP